MTDNNLSAAAKAARRIAAAEAAATAADNQARPLGPPAVYTYDADGRLLSATPGETTDTDPPAA
jgi:hypothetical protein